MKNYIILMLLLGTSDPVRPVPVAKDPAHLVPKDRFDGMSDEEVFACACPSIVAFCKKWEREWACRNGKPCGTARSCVIDMMH